MRVITSAEPTDHYQAATMSFMTTNEGEQTISKPALGHLVQPQLAWIENARRVQGLLQPPQHRQARP